MRESDRVRPQVLLVLSIEKQKVADEGDRAAGRRKVAEHTAMEERALAEPLGVVGRQRDGSVEQGLGKIGALLSGDFRCATDQQIDGVAPGMPP